LQEFRSTACRRGIGSNLSKLSLAHPYANTPNTPIRRYASPEVPLQINADVQLDVGCALGGVIGAGPEIIKSARETPPSGHFE
jgi:hypothetical protein